MQGVELKPEIVKQDGKIIVKYGVNIDLDNDGVSSIKAGAFIELTEKEAANELIKKAIASGKLPDWLKNLLGVG